MLTSPGTLNQNGVTWKARGSIPKGDKRFSLETLGGMVE